MDSWQSPRIPWDLFVLQPDEPPNPVPFEFTNAMFQQQQRNTIAILKYVRSEPLIGSTGRNLLQLTRVLGTTPILSPPRPVRR